MEQTGITVQITPEVVQHFRDYLWQPSVKFPEDEEAFNTFVIAQSKVEDKQQHAEKVIRRIGWMMMDSIAPRIATAKNRNGVILTLNLREKTPDESR